MAGPSDYHRGEMDISEQKATFHLVMGMTKWGSLYIAGFLLLFTMWFCTETGFLGSLAAGVALIVAGTFLLSEKKGAGGH